MNKPQHPLSPHLQIYRLPLTAWLSITHRFTGVVLVLGVIALTASLIVLANKPSAWQSIAPFLDSYFITVSLVIMSFSFWLHWLHGLRHLIWDAGSGFNLKYARFIDGLEIALAIILSALVWVTHTLSV